MRARRVVVVGAGPNGLTAAAMLAQAGLRVEVFEANERVGGACTTAELTLPGFRHDVGSSAFPMGVSSPVFRRLELERYGLEWVQPESPVAHVLDGGEAVVAERSVRATAEGLGREDGAAWRRLMGPLAARWAELAPELLGPVVHVPRHAGLMARFGVDAVQPAAVLARRLFRGERARALFAGMAAHAVLPLGYPTSAAVALVLGAAAHAVGWPVARGGAGAITEALLRCLRVAGGEVHTGVRVRSLRELPPADAVLCDLTPEGLLRVAGEELTPSFRSLLGRFRRGPGSFKVDWALRGPIPWASEGARRAGTVHVGGTLGEVAASERAMWEGTAADWPAPERPFLIAVQPSVADVSRGPELDGGERGHTAWAYCHVPNGWRGDATAAIEAQMERFAPGFGRVVLARRVWGTRALEAWDTNLLGGDLSGGAMTPWQLAMRPTTRLYGTSRAGLFLCSSSTPPGGGVHGMCGYGAAQAAMRWLRGR